MSGVVFAKKEDDRIGCGSSKTSKRYGHQGRECGVAQQCECEFHEEETTGSARV